MLSTHLLRLTCRAVPARAHLSLSALKPAVYAIQSEEEFKSKVLGGSKPVVVDFSATWCGPCKMLTPRLEAAVAATEDAVDLAIVDIDDFSDLALEHDVSAVPTVIGVKNGAIVDRFVGLIDEDRLGSFIGKLKE
ncbi:thioredoxin, mitochondrial [Eurytemora carolleeae]|uniref:thioredoxin, mitochondrial n=1 Tax=Eurytemora carolleeae TaxID=1294199 RepID=UPI000C77D784|nr:thioredoxin, mitochondrial [Eurytemora carolleeae]|eukprot:XP_023336745.1 thioredoxin, mitochondrial-like [Eurytemora affinis]